MRSLLFFLSFKSFTTDEIIEELQTKVNASDPQEFRRKAHQILEFYSVREENAQYLLDYFSPEKKVAYILCCDTE